MTGLITSSRLRVFRRCRREHHLRYVLGRTSAASKAQDFGSLVHLGLEAWWDWHARPHAPDVRDFEIRTEDPVNALIEATKAMRAAAEGVDPYDLARAEAMLIGYDCRWGAEQYEVLAVEAEFRAALPALPFEEPQRLGGKLDALVRDSQGRVLIVEHKTSSEDISTGSAYWARLRLDGQVSLYYLGAEALGYEVAGVLYDVLGKPKQEPGKAVEVVRYTKEKRAKCKECKGKGRGAFKDGRLWECATCAGVGTVVTEASRPHAGQRLTDETPDEYRARIVEALAADPDRYFQRLEIVRLEGERAAHLEELRAEVRELATAAPLPNPDQCVRFGSVCSFFPACSGERRIDEYTRLDWPHPELTEDVKS